MAKQTPFKALANAVESIGGTMDPSSAKGTKASGWTGNWGFDIAIDAPEGKVWSCTGTHSLVCGSDDCSSRAEMNTAFDDACRSMLEDVEDGVESCEIEDCDICAGL